MTEMLAKEHSDHESGKAVLAVISILLISSGLLVLLASFAIWGLHFWSFLPISAGTLMLAYAGRAMPKFCAISMVAGFTFLLAGFATELINSL